MKNKKVEIIKVSVISIFIFLTIYTPSAVAYNYSKIILVAWDGAQYNDTLYLYKSGQLNGLKEILKDGSLARLLITDHDTWTDPGFVQILSGYSPNITGVDGRKFEMWQILPNNLSIFEKLKLRSISTAVINSRDAAYRWTSNNTLLKDSYSGDAGHGYFEWNFKNAMDSIDYYWDATNYSIENSQYVDIVDNTQTNISSNSTVYLRQIDAKQTEPQAEKWLVNHTSDRFFLFVQFGDPDTKGHNKGEGSTEYLNAIKDSDNNTLKLIDYLKSLGIYNDTILMVVTDHGFKSDAYEHWSDPYPAGDPDTYITFIAINKRITSNLKTGYQGDIVPTIYELFGINYTSIYPPFDKAVPIWMR